MHKSVPKSERAKSGRWFRSVTVPAMFQTFLYCLFTALLSSAYGQHVYSSASHATTYELTTEQQEELLEAHNYFRRDAAFRFGAANLGPLVT